jgi:hypothetical protein
MDKKEFRNVKSIYKYPRLKVIGEVLANVVMRKRIDCHRDLAYAFNYEKYVDSTLKKTIIFSSYVDVCEAADKMCKKYKYNPVNVYGSSTKYLNSLVGEFNTIEKKNPLITTFKSLSTGVPLIIANVIIALDVPFRRYIYEQAIGRAWRTGQDSPVFVYIPELDTGDDYNINSRTIDIMEFYMIAVRDITGADIPEDMLKKNVKTDDSSLSTESLELDLNILPSVNKKHILDEW